MEAFLIYLLKSGTALTAFYLFFLLVFRRRKQFRFNRLYLFLSMPISYLLPLITIKVTATEVVIPQIINTTPTTAAQPPATEAATTNWPAIALLIFAAGAGFFLLRLLISNLRAISLIRKSEKARLHETDCCVCKQEVHPFSFFNRIIIPREVLNSEHLPVILKHEQIHVHEQHTIDVFTTELLFLLQWFNPFAWLLKDALKNNLEYLTDDQIIQTTNRQHYQLAMLAMADKEGVAPFLTALNGSQLKDRILMMKQKTTNKKQIWRQLLLLPLLTMLVLTLSNKRFEAAPLSANGDLISGTVKIENNTQTLGGVSVLIKGTYTGTITDAKGEFKLKVNNFPSTLVFAFPGFAKQEIVVESPQELSVNLTADNPPPTESWKPGPNPLYIVDGKKVDSIKEIDPETIESISVLKAQSGIELYGQEAQDGVIDIKLKQEPKKRKKKDETSLNSGEGKTITANEAGVPETAFVQIRSIKNANAKPLIIVDGVNKGNIDVKSLQINPENIKSIDVLKDESAIEKYGDEAKDGVILITTKR